MVQERNRIQLPLEEIKLAFAASCVEGTARKLHCRRLHHGNAEGIVLREGVIKVLTDIFGHYCPIKKGNSIFEILEL